MGKIEPKSDRSRAKLGHVRPGFLGVLDVAQILGVNETTVRRWCESGKLPAIAKPFGKKTTWEISPQAIELFQQAMDAKKVTPKQAKLQQTPHVELIPLWVKAMKTGTLNGKVFSPKTVSDYQLYIDQFFKRHRQVTPEALSKELMRLDPKRFSSRFHTYHAVLCFAKYLINLNALDSTFVEDVKSLKPKRHLPPKRHTVTESQLLTLLDACQNAYDRCLVVLLSQTGLRASEFCALTLEDINTEQCALLVKLGKGGRARKIGLSTQALAALQKHLEEAGPLPKSGHLFRDSNGKQLTPRGLHARLERIGKKAKVQVSPHGLRRAFVTINANKGRPLQMLQRACGHSDIKTTMGYCLTSENEVIEAMKGWE